MLASEMSGPDFEGHAMQADEEPSVEIEPVVEPAVEPALEPAVELAAEPSAPVETVDKAAHDMLIGRYSALESEAAELSAKVTQLEAENATLRQVCASYELSAALVGSKLPASAGQLVRMAYAQAKPVEPIGVWLPRELKNPASPLAVLSALSSPPVNADPRNNVGAGPAAERATFGRK